LVRFLFNPVSVSVFQKKYCLGDFFLNNWFTEPVFFKLVKVLYLV